MREITGHELGQVEGAIVIDNCGTIRLQSGEHVVADSSVIINPEDGATREFFIEETGEYITLPVDYEAD